MKELLLSETMLLENIQKYCVQVLRFQFIVDCNLAREKNQVQAEAQHLTYKVQKEIRKG